MTGSSHSSSMATVLEPRVSADVIEPTIEDRPVAVDERAEPVTVEPADRDQPSVGRYIGMGIVFVSLAIFAVTGIAMLLYLGDLVPALGIAAFLTFWFGPPFGLIFGGAVWAEHTEGMH